MAGTISKRCLISAFTALLTAAAFVGCGQGGGSSSETETETEPETVWAPPGGNATVAYDETEPFIKIATSIDENEIATISQGRELFIAQWQPAPGTRATLDGLGPLYNADACTACHVSNGRVAPYNDDGTLDPSFLFRIGDEQGGIHPVYGSQLQTQATAGTPEGNVTWLQNGADGKIIFVSTPDIGSDGYNIGGRIAPHLLGMGLLNLVPEESILAYADPDDLDGDGISGRAHWVVEENETRLGRFGWKAINASLRTQNAGAMHQDMGLTTPVNPNENCTDAQEICAAETSGGTPEVSEASLGAIVNFMTALGVPERRIDDQDAFDAGARLFASVGCAACHRPTMTTGTSDKFSSLSAQTFYPYTDLLLHDMGEDLSDGVREKNATGSEWRTPPLWGIGIVEARDGARFLHDGRAATIREAIEQHGGEAEKARERFLQLDTAQTDSLLQFLRGI